MVRALVVAAVVAVCGMGACAPVLDGNDDAPATAELRTTVRVANHNWSDVNVYIVRNGVPTRLGMVNSMSAGTFVLPRDLLGGGDDLRLMADRVGATENVMSERLLLASGQTLEWRVEQNLALSSLTVR